MKCGAHRVDLLLKDFGKFEFFQSTNERVNKVIKFVKNRYDTAAISGLSRSFSLSPLTPRASAHKLSPPCVCTNYKPRVAVN